MSIHIKVDQNSQLQKFWQMTLVGFCHVKHVVFTFITSLTHLCAASVSVMFAVPVTSVASAVSAVSDVSAVFLISAAPAVSVVLAAQMCALFKIPT